AQQEAAREQRVRWQVDAAQVEARLGAARERAGRAAAEAEEARRQSTALADEMSALEHETATLTAQRTQWEDQLKERRLALVALEAAAGEAGAEVEAADARVAETETALEDVRKALDARGAEEHKLELERTEIVGRRRGLVARVEAEWRKPLDQLLAEAPVVAGDLEWLRQEDERLRAAIDAVGPVNALAVDEHGEEVKRLEFLMTQRNDLVAARQSLQQAAREIDQTAKAMFLDSFGKVRDNFRTVFQTLFGGGECDVRLANEDEPLESEIEIHAAPRGKRTQRIHLLSSGERTLVAVSSCSRSSWRARARSVCSTRWTRRSTTPTSAATCACSRSSRTRRSSSSSPTTRAPCRPPTPCTASPCRSPACPRSWASASARWNRSKPGAPATPGASRAALPGRHAARARCPGGPRGAAAR